MLVIHQNVYCSNKHGSLCFQVAKLPFTLLGVDPMYKMDDNSIPEWLRPEGLKHILQTFDGKTTAPQYTIVVWCSFAQAESFRQVLLDFCR